MFKIQLFVVLFVSFASLCWSQCNEVFDTTVSDEDKETILNRHNEYRLNIAKGLVPDQPKGTNLRKLIWDGKLALAAQNISNTCVFKHVWVNDTRFYVGQNLYMWTSTGADSSKNWNRAIDSWYNEYKKYQYPNSTSHETGHYTQLVWATSKYVGCGFTYFTTNDKQKYRKIYACNYGPNGNVMGQPPYKITGNECPDLC